MLMRLWGSKAPPSRVFKARLSRVGSVETLMGDLHEINVAADKITAQDERSPDRAHQMIDR